MRFKCDVGRVRCRQCGEPVGAREMRPMLITDEGQADFFHTTVLQGEISDCGPLIVERLGAQKKAPPTGPGEWKDKTPEKKAPPPFPAPPKLPAIELIDIDYYKFLAKYEQDMIFWALLVSKKNIQQAARILKMKRTTVAAKMRRWGWTWNRKAEIRKVA